MLVKFKKIIPLRDFVKNAFIEDGEKFYSSCVDDVLLRNTNEVGIPTLNWNLVKEHELISIISMYKKSKDSVRSGDEELFYKNIVDDAPNLRYKQLAKYSLLLDSTEVSLDYTIGNMALMGIKHNKIDMNKTLRYKFKSLHRAVGYINRTTTHYSLRDKNYDRTKDEEAFFKFICDMHGKVVETLENLNCDFNFKDKFIKMDLSPITEAETYLMIPREFVSQIREE